MGYSGTTRACGIAHPTVLLALRLTPMTHLANGRVQERGGGWAPLVTRWRRDYLERAANSLCGQQGRQCCQIWNLKDLEKELGSSSGIGKLVRCRGRGNSVAVQDKCPGRRMPHPGTDPRAESDSPGRRVPPLSTSRRLAPQADLDARGGRVEYFAARP